MATQTKDHGSPQTAPAPAPPSTETGIWSWITTVDHKRIGILYFWTAFFFFLVGGIEALLVRTQLIVPNNTSSRPSSTTRCSRCTR
jgi:hypothetical protein